jgi:CRP-like cAMP-binding protein
MEILAMEDNCMPVEATVLPDAVPMDTAMTCTHFAAGNVLFREGDPADSVFRLLSGAVDILRELDGDPVLLARLARDSL